jgi:hypothetical protein
MRLLKLIVAISLIFFSLEQGAWSKERSAKGPPRRVIYSYNQSGLIIIVIVQETAAGAKGNVTVVGASWANPAVQDNFYISHAEFEQIWSTLNAPGVEKRPYAGNEHEAEDYYIFDGGNQRYSVKKAQSAPAVSALSSRIRRHVDALMKSGMRPLPAQRATATPRPR